MEGVFIMQMLIDKYFDELSSGQSQVKDNLQLIPLFHKRERQARDYLLLDEAMENNCLKVSELTEQGNVNTLQVTNQGKQEVLILDGEELVGAKQNRMVNATILIAAESNLTIPVSCVERGRWRYESTSFDRSEVFGYSELRRKKAAYVAENLSAAGSFESNQHEVWEEIDRKQARMGSRSQTDAMHDVFSQYERELDDFITGLKPMDGQIGIAVYINGSFNCMDIFGHPEVLERLWKKLLKSYAMEALELKKESKKNTQHQHVEQLLTALREAEFMNYPSVGLGQDVRLKSRHYIAAGLVADDVILHLAAFQNDPGSNLDSPIARPSRRRRMQ